MKCILALLLSASLFGKMNETPPPRPTVVILGGGVGALTSALYLSRGGLEPIVIEGRSPGGALTQTHSIQNWPGEMDIDGALLTDKIHKQVEANGARFFQDEVVAVDFSQRPFKLTLRSLDGKNEERDLFADACIIAMGSTPNYLGIAGEIGPDGYWGRGVTNCALCDGSLYRDRVVGVVGGGDAAVLEVSYLANLAQKVHVFVRQGEFKATEKKRLEALFSLPNVTVHYDTTVQEIYGDGEKLTHVLLKKKGTIEEKLPLDGLFLAIGSKPNTEIFKGQLQLDEKGYLLLEKNQQTSIEGVYAIGDIVDPIYKQAITASADGCKAALHLQNFLSAETKIASRQIEEKREWVKAPFTTTGHVIEIQSMEQFENELRGDTPVIVDFYATWCGPCKLLAPLFEHSAEVLSGKVKFLKVNVDKFRGLNSLYGIRAMPTVLVFDETGKETDRRVGTDKITSYLKKLEAQNNL